MFGRRTKVATTMIELLILLAIVGILSVMYQKIVKRDTLTTKISYLQVLKNMVGFATTETNGYQNLLDDKVCHRFYHSINTIGEKNCEGSSIPDIANLTAVNGMRFFWLQGGFSNNYPDPNSNNAAVGYKFIYVDLDGVAGANTIGKDILPFELTQDGHIRPTGEQVISSTGLTTLKGNVARDPELFSTKVYCVGPKCDPDATNPPAKGEWNMGTRLSYLEAQCLTGNPFPYRASDNGEIQMCVKDTSVYNAVKDNIASLDVVIKAYWKNIMGITSASSPADSSICDDLYTKTNSGAYGLVSMNDSVKRMCRSCYRAVYKAKYCPKAVSASADCPSSVINERSTCITSDYVE